MPLKPRRKRAKEIAIAPYEGSMRRSAWGAAPKGELRMGNQNRVLRIGQQEQRFRDLYHLTLTLTWPRFLGLLSIFYLTSNLCFAGLYLIGGDNIANAVPGSLADAFFFSVQTMATIGYGAMAPQTVWANMVVTLEALFGLVISTLIAGLMFARFARPTARVMFSTRAVIAPHNGVPTLIFRAANQRRNQIIEATVRVTMLRDERTEEGTWMRRFHELPLLRGNSPMFALSWTVMHPITPASPLYDLTPETLAESGIEIVVMLSGLDETLSQLVHARHSYLPEDLHWNHRLVDVLGTTEDGRRAIDYRRFHDVVPIDPALDES